MCRFAEDWVKKQDCRPNRASRILECMRLSVGITAGWLFWVGLVAWAPVQNHAFAADCLPSVQCCLKGHEISKPLSDLILMAAQEAVPIGASSGKVAQLAAKALSITLKESAGDPTCVTDMKGRSAGPQWDWTSPRASTPRWDAQTVDNHLSRHNGVTYDKQTNFGLLQQSQDVVLDNKNGEFTSLVFEMQALIRSDPNEALRRCRSGDFFFIGQGASAFFDVVGACDPMASHKCFGKLVMLCPALNAELGIRKLRKSPKYFETHKAAPICEAYFKQKIDLQSGANARNARVSDQVSKPLAPVQPPGGRAGKPAQSSATAR